MKISEAQNIYRAHRQELLDQTRNLIRQREEAQRKYHATGSVEFSEQAVTLQLSVDAVKEKFEENEKILDELAEQHALAWNAEVARQQADTGSEQAEEYAKLMTVAMRISRGDIVPYKDEKKLLEAYPDMYQAAKSAQMLHQLDEKRKKHKSLWKDEEEGPEAVEYDPQGKADNAEVMGDLPEIEAAPETGEGL
ncbi:MAG: hypothetical protein OSJ69_04635 [Acetatifactor sp.]|nr:hypothetical protein [Acetatifactor sp.]